ncbi:MAG: DNA primase [Rhodanobacteraceae bacterium]
MAGLIPESFIDDLLARVDIVEVVERRVPLKKSGHEWTACCPFHNERTPSFTVSPQKQFYHCFGCGAHGSAISFLMEYEHLEFPDAIEELAQGLGLSVPHEGGDAPRKSHQGLYALMDEVAAHYRKALAGNREAREYCHQRGLDDETLQRFGIGWAAQSGLIQALGHSPGRMAMLEEAGMIARGDSGLYERFRRRLMIPIRDRRGRVIAFGGRLLAGEGAKYLNSPETPLFHKGRELFGLWEVKQANTKLDRIVVVEGYMDAIALHQAGLPIAVATLGTSTTSEHAERLFRSAGDIIFAFDGDRAGRDAAWRALENILPQLTDGRQAWFLFLPDGEDPDSVVRAEGCDGFEKRIADAMPLSRYFFAELERDVDIGSIDGRARLVSKAQPLLEKLPAGSFRQLMLRELEKHSGASVRLTPNGPAQPRPPRQAQRRASLVRNMIALLLHQPTLAAELPSDQPLKSLRLPGIDLLAELLQHARQRDDMTTAMLVQHFEDHPHSDALHRLLTAERLVPGEALRAEFLDGIRVLERQAVTQRIAELVAAQKNGTLDDAAKDELRQLLARKAAVDQED